MTSHRGQGAIGPLSEHRTPVVAVPRNQEVHVVVSDAEIDAEVVDEISSLSGGERQSPIASAEQQVEQAPTEYGLPLSQIPWPTGRTLRTSMDSPARHGNGARLRNTTLPASNSDEHSPGQRGRSTRGRPIQSSAGANTLQTIL